MICQIQYDFLRIPGQYTECVYTNGHFPGYTFYRNGQIPKDISQKSVAELTFLNIQGDPFKMSHTTKFDE